MENNSRLSVIITVVIGLFKAAVTNDIDIYLKSWRKPSTLFWATT